MANNTITLYTVSALYRKKKYGSYQYEWKLLREFGSKKEAVEYAKRQSKIQYTTSSNTGRYMIRKEVIDSFYEDGKKTM